VGFEGKKARGERAFLGLVRKTGEPDWLTCSRGGGLCFYAALPAAILWVVEL
jgi:hypothetical protein